MTSTSRTSSTTWPVSSATSRRPPRRRRLARVEAAPGRFQRPGAPVPGELGEEQPVLGDDDGVRGHALVRDDRARSRRVSPGPRAPSDMPGRAGRAGSTAYRRVRSPSTPSAATACRPSPGPASRRPGRRRAQAKRDDDAAPRTPDDGDHRRAPPPGGTRRRWRRRPRPVLRRGGEVVSADRARSASSPARWARAPAR